MAGEDANDPQDPNDPLGLWTGMSPERMAGLNTTVQSNNPHLYGEQSSEDSILSQPRKDIVRTSPEWQSPDQQEDEKKPDLSKWQKRKKAVKTLAKGAYDATEGKKPKTGMFETVSAHKKAVYG